MISGGTEPVEPIFLDTEPVEPNRLLNNRLWTEPCTTNRKLEPNRTESNRYHTAVVVDVNTNDVRSRLQTC